MIILKGYIDVVDEDLKTIKLELANHIKLTREEKGCLVFNVEQDEENNNRFNVYEEFLNYEAFEEHQKRVKRSCWGTVTKYAQRNYKVKKV